jgi:hypothetical protein
MRTKTQLLVEIRRHKTCSLAQLNRYLAAFDIKPLGVVRQRPQLFPNDAAARILAQLGFETECSAPACPKRSNGIPTLNELRAERAQARKQRRAA